MYHRKLLSPSKYVEHAPITGSNHGPRNTGQWANTSAGGSFQTMRQEDVRPKLAQGLYRKKKLWANQGREEFKRVALDPWAKRRRQELLQLLGNHPTFENCIEMTEIDRPTIGQ